MMQIIFHVLCDFTSFYCSFPLCFAIYMLHSQNLFYIQLIASHMYLKITHLNYPACLNTLGLPPLNKLYSVPFSNETIHAGFF